MIRKIAITSSLVIGIIIAMIIERNVEGTHYASLVLAALLSGYWTGELIYNYILFRKSYRAEYDIYKVQVINSNQNLTLEHIAQRNKYYYKKFKRTKLKDSIFRIIFISCCFGMTIAIISALFI